MRRIKSKKYKRERRKKVISLLAIWFVFVALLFCSGYLMMCYPHDDFVYVGCLSICVLYAFFGRGYSIRVYELDAEDKKQLAKEQNEIDRDN